MATETEFIDWLRNEKGIDINRKMSFSTYGSLGKTYKTKEGIELFYGLGLKGFPPHLDLSFIMFKRINYKGDTCFDYPLIQRSFYSDKYSNDDRYQMLIKNKFLILE